MVKGMQIGQTRQRGVSLDHVWLFAGVAFIALRVLLTPIQPHDFWWHMATGRVIVATGTIPTVDSFSYTQVGQPFYNQSWLAQVGMYLLFSVGGAPLIIFVQVLLLAFAYGLLLRLAIRQSGRLRLSVGVLLLGTLPASFDNWLVRPQSYALVIFIIYLYILTVWRDPHEPRRQQALWPPLLLLPLLGMIWVNVHGSFVLGGALIGLIFVGEVLRRWIERRQARRRGSTAPLRPPLVQLIIIGSLTGLSWLINPGGLQVLGYVGNLLSSSQVTQLVTEWAPPTTRDLNGAIFFLFVMAGIVILAYAHTRPDPVDMLLAGAFLWLALGAGRNNIWFVAVVSPLLARQLAAWRPAEAPARLVYQGLPMFNAMLVGLISLLLVLALPWVKPWLDLPPEVGSLLAPETPVDAVALLRQDPQRPERLFHDMGYGSYLIWAAPEQKVWADPRIELYPLEQWLDYQRLTAGTKVEPLIEAYQIDGLLLSNEQQAALVAWAEEQPTWELRFRDEVSSYFVLRR